MAMSKTAKVILIGGGVLLAVFFDRNFRNRFGGGIFLESIEAIDKVGADDLVAAYSYTGALPHVGTGERPYCFVGERAGA